MQSAYARPVTKDSLRHTVRRSMLAKLIEEAGGVTELARKVYGPTRADMKSHISALKEGKRGIGDTLATKLEKKCGKPPGWMDGREASDVLPPPTPPRNFHYRHNVSDSDWARLEELNAMEAAPPIARKLAQLRKELVELKQFAKYLEEQAENRAAERETVEVKKSPSASPTMQGDMSIDPGASDSAGKRAEDEAEGDQEERNEKSRQVQAHRDRLRREEHERQLESIKALASRQQAADAPAQLTSTLIADELAKLAELKSKGILNEDEFNGQKAALLRRSQT